MDLALPALAVLSLAAFAAAAAALLAGGGLVRILAVAGRWAGTALRFNDLEPAERNRFTMLMIVAVVAASLACAMMIGPMGVALGSLLAVFGVKTLAAAQKEQRERRLERQLPVAVDMLVGQLTTRSLTDNIRQLADALPQPVARIFINIDRTIALGEPVTMACAEVADLQNDDHVRLVLSVIEVFAEQGGEAKESLQEMSTAFKEIARLREKLNTAAAGAKATMMLINGAAGFIVLFVAVTQPQLLEAFTGSAIGLVGLALAVVLWVLGIYRMRKIVRVVV